MGITLVFPSFPPAQILYEFLTIPKTTLSICGISVATLLNGITNGFFWILIAATTYALTRRTKSASLHSIPVPPDLSTPSPEPMLSHTPIDKLPPSITTRKKPTEIEQDIETINGIGPKWAGLLRESGIKTVNDLVMAGATKHERQHLADKVGVPYATMLKWVNRGDMLRVNGIGKKHSALLESAGVNTVIDLSTRDPSSLCETLSTLNFEENLVRRTPPSKTIENWVKNAKNLEPVI
jgi:predicted flap endonuclease-1-like 5' DNA nuclease